MSKTVSTGEMISEIARDTGLTQATISSIWTSIFANITMYMSQGNRIVIRGFGTFEPQERAPRIGRNPHTGKAVPIPARVIPKFTPSETLKNAAYKPIKNARSKR